MADPWGVIGAAAAILAAVPGLAALLGARSSQYRQMRKEYGTREGGIGLRRCFWTGIDEHYRRFRANRKEPLPELHALIDSAGMPPGIIGCSEISTYRPAGADPDQRAVWDFANSPYPAEGQPLAKDIDEWNLCRSLLGDYWDDWSRRLSIRKLALEYKMERPCLLLLTWLDPPHCRWSGKKTPGKQAMYRLAAMLQRDWEAEQRRSEQR